MRAEILEILQHELSGDSLLVLNSTMPARGTKKKYGSDVPESHGTCHLRSYLTPVRDEEAESQRKARSRQARQTRRSTQGVTLSELKEAQRIFGQLPSDRPADGPGLDRTAGAKDEGLSQGAEAPSRDPEAIQPKWDKDVDELGNLRPGTGTETESPSTSCTSPPAGCSVFHPLSSLSNRPSKELDQNVYSAGCAMQRLENTSSITRLLNK
ncbi:protein phosphatase 1 regulatory subunit 12A-like [Scleropages formosus]|uniref:protein phosphatase 1 regulatory subunit 12A-like n=1 Tax=Scleropages formosus TaxID=113540 RepID=UPI0008786348|nr:protein phosphatase 1 regulatory subunit 12A-like [Scleropages formosus]XP_029102317.1 protein phosphatase 1 regulatory subunit 12A-like [Scleropages formosus]